MTKHFFIITISIILRICDLHAQNVPTQLSYEGMLWSSNDTFYVKGSTWEKAWSMTTTESDTIDLGTDGFPGASIIVWTTSDTLTVPYVNSPYEQWLYIRVVSANGKTVYRLRFNEQSAAYTDEYSTRNKGKIEISIPETFELANVILYLSECSRKTMNHPEESEYAKQVSAYFRPYENHKIIQILNKKCSGDGHWLTYYDFRENSICYAFNENRLEFNTPYKKVWNGAEIQGGEFRSLLYLVQDFAEKTNFRKFYAEHVTYYRDLEKRQAELLPVAQMWKWLEKEFPQRKDSYKIIFSPLIEGAHSTQQFFKGFFNKPEFQECIMFVNAPESLDAHKEYSEELKKGLMSGIVFTEIDHNYVNPASAEHIANIRELVHDKNFWATEEAQKNYPSEYAIFNEYMTHSLFCLYVTENNEVDLAKQIIEKRIEIMKRRGYPKFREFNDKLIALTNNRKETIYQLYGEIIAEMKSIK